MLVEYGSWLSWTTNMMNIDENCSYLVMLINVPGSCSLANSQFHIEAQHQFVQYNFFNCSKLTSVQLHWKTGWHACCHRDAINCTNKDNKAYFLNASPHALHSVVHTRNYMNNRMKNKVVRNSITVACYQTGHAGQVLGLKHTSAWFYDQSFEAGYLCFTVVSPEKNTNWFSHFAFVNLEINCFRSWRTDISMFGTSVYESRITIDGFAMAVVPIQVKRLIVENTEFILVL